MIFLNELKENGLPIECCDKESVPIQPRYLHPACMPISVPSDDSYYKPIRVTCLNYVRSALAVNSKCKFGGANQVSFTVGKSFDSKLSTV